MDTDCVYPSFFEVDLHALISSGLKKATRVLHDWDLVEFQCVSCIFMSDTFMFRYIAPTCMFAHVGSFVDKWLTFTQSIFEFGGFRKRGNTGLNLRSRSAVWRSCMRSSQTLGYLQHICNTTSGVFPFCR